MPSLYWAELDTSRYTFDAFGSSAIDAEAVMVQLTKQHCERNQINWDEFFAAYWDSLHVEEVRNGYGFRDGDNIYDREIDSGN